MKAGQKEALVVARDQLWSVYGAMEQAVIAAARQTETMHDIRGIRGVADAMDKVREAIKQLGYRVASL